MIRAMTALAFAASLGACATAPASYDLVPVRSNGQPLAGLDSATILESRHSGGIVSIRADQQFAVLGASFAVAVHNTGGAPIAFGPDDIEVSAGGRRLPILAADELDARVRGDARGYIRATSRTGEIDIEAASAMATREYRFNNYGGCPAGQSGCQVYSADNGSGYRQDRINRQLEAGTLAAVANQLQANQALIAERALRPASVAPDAMAGGVFVVEPPKDGSDIEIVVTLNGQKHAFAFSARPA